MKIRAQIMEILNTSFQGSLGSIIHYLKGFSVKHIFLIISVMSLLSFNVSKLSGQTILNTALTEDMTVTDPVRIVLAHGFRTTGYDFRAYIDGMVDFNRGDISISNENYIHTMTPQVPMTFISGGKASQVYDEIAYFDGLGRPMQTLVPFYTPVTGEDLVQSFEYDDFGRESKSYLPYTQELHGAYISAWISPQEAFYNNRHTGEGVYAFSEKTFDNSPLNRVFEQGAPGEDWQIQKDEYEVSNYTGNTQQITYRATSKYITEIRDENGNLSREEKNIEGFVVGKQVHDGTQWTYTKYVYDEFRRLKYVIPPEANGVYDPKWCYHYVYDEKGRMIEKQLPGAEPVYMVYNKRDLLVATQDGVQGSKSPKEWTFTKYDQHNRPVITGIYKCDDNRQTVQSDVNSNSYSDYETFGGSMHGYNNSAFPVVENGGDYYTFTYYDNYDFIEHIAYATPNANGLSNVAYSNFEDERCMNTSGLVTGTKIKVLNSESDHPAYLMTTNYYDKYGRVIQVIGENYKEGADRISTSYDFAGKVKYTIHEHTAAGQIPRLLGERFTYDHKGRLIKHYLQLAGENEIVMAENEYDELGQLIQKQLHSENSGKIFKQDIDYTYNIRNWLTAINDPENLGNDLFGMHLLYNEAEAGLTQQEQYNGNINAMVWNAKRKTGSGTLVESYKGYGFEYDGLNRLTDAYYAEGTGFGTAQGDYDVALKYDKNGNIIELERFQGGTRIDFLDYKYLGNQLIGVGDADDDALGFKELVNGNDADETYESTWEYNYDANGNLKYDDNKNISNIFYNYMNLPEEISLNGSTIEYAYDATGRKVLHINNINSKRTYYCGNFVYEDGGMYILTSEGRIIVNDSAVAYEYNLKDHLGNTRVVFNEEGDWMQTSDYYPFGMRFGQTSPSGGSNNPYLYNGKELQEDIDWYDYGARYFDPAIARWHSIDPLAETYSSWSPYHYAMNNPIRYTDVFGMGAGDFVDENMKYLGTDGKKDGNVYVVTDKNEKKAIKKTDKAGGTTAVSDAKSATQLPSANVRGEMGKAVDRSNSANTGRTDQFKGDDNEGGFHEEGGVYGTDASGNEKVVHAAPGAKADPKANEMATVTPGQAANSSEQGSLTNEEGSFHVHPSGSRSEFKSDGMGGGTTKTWSFNQNPTDPMDYTEAGGYSGNSYVLGAGNNSVTVINGSGKVLSIKNLKKFINYKAK